MELQTQRALLLLTQKLCSGGSKIMDMLYGIPWRKGSKPGISAELSRAGTASTAGPAVDGSGGKTDNPNTFPVRRALDIPIKTPIKGTRGKLDNPNTVLSTQSTEHPNKYPNKWHRGKTGQLQHIFSTRNTEHSNKLNTPYALHTSKWSASRRKTGRLSWQQLTNFLFPEYFDNIPAEQNHRSLFVILRQGYQSNKDTTGVNSKVFSPRYVMLTQQLNYFLKAWDSLN